MVTRCPDRQLLAGPTAYALMRMRFRCTTVTLAVLALGYALNVSGVPVLWLMYTVLAMAGISILPLLVLILWVPIRTQTEEEGGYTTLQYGKTKLEQRDPYLGRVIRAPGEDYLERAQFQAILQAAKDEAGRLKPHRR
ncbi:membrane protein implicated in regulation of membrane protease activity [Arthrobacter sp. GAS37]